MKSVKDTVTGWLPIESSRCSVSAHLPGHAERDGNSLRRNEQVNTGGQPAGSQYTP